MFKPISDWDKSTESTRIFLENLAASAQLKQAVEIVVQEGSDEDAWETIFVCCQEVEALA